MGEVLSTVKTVIDFSNKVVAEVDREKNRKLSKEADKLSNPIKPPEPWPTLKARRSKVKTGPYTVEGMRESLENLTLPVGWSEEQLEKSGFGPEVEEYRRAVEKERRDLFASFGSALLSLADAVETELTGPDRALRTALRKAGVTQATVNRFRNLARKAKDGKLEPQAVSLAISEMRTLLEKAELEKQIAAGLAASDADLAAASDVRAAGILSIARRSLGVPRKKIEAAA